MYLASTQLPVLWLTREPFSGVLRLGDSEHHLGTRPSAMIFKDCLGHRGQEKQLVEESCWSRDIKHVFIQRQLPEPQWRALGFRLRTADIIWQAVGGVYGDLVQGSNSSCRMLRGLMMVCRMDCTMWTKKAGA